jgi:hypothetical protein
MPRHWLAIEHHPQEVDAGCLAACVQMALSHLGVVASQQALNRLLGLTPAGVPASRLARLKRHGVQVTLRQGTLDNLRRAVDRGLAPIVFVCTGQLPYGSLDTHTRPISCDARCAPSYLTPPASWGIIRARCGVEQRQLVGLITRRSQVRILAPLPERRARSSGQCIGRGLTIFGSWSPHK